MRKSFDKNRDLQENINFFILNSMDDWVRIIDDFGQVTFINDALKEALKKSPKLKTYLDENIDLIISNILGEYIFFCTRLFQSRISSASVTLSGRIKLPSFKLMEGENSITSSL